MAETRKPMKEPADFAKRRYEISDCPNESFTFAELCAHFGLKYRSVYKLVYRGGLTVEEAVKHCIKNPYSWGGLLGGESIKS